MRRPLGRLTRLPRSPRPAAAAARGRRPLGCLLPASDAALSPLLGGARRGHGPRAWRAEAAWALSRLPGTSPRLRARGGRAAVRAFGRKPGGARRRRPSARNLVAALVAAAGRRGRRRRTSSAIRDPAVRADAALLLGPVARTPGLRGAAPAPAGGGLGPPPCGGRPRLALAGQVPRAGRVTGATSSGCTTSTTTTAPLPEVRLPAGAAGRPRADRQRRRPRHCAREGAPAAGELRGRGARRGHEAAVGAPARPVHRPESL